MIQVSVNAVVTAPYGLLGSLPHCWIVKHSSFYGTKISAHATLPRPPSHSLPPATAQSLIPVFLPLGDSDTLLSDLLGYGMGGYGCGLFPPTACPLLHLTLKDLPFRGLEEKEGAGPPSLR